MHRHVRCVWAHLINRHNENYIPSRSVNAVLGERLLFSKKHTFTDYNAADDGDDVDGLIL